MAPGSANDCSFPMSTAKFKLVTGTPSPALQAVQGPFAVTVVVSLSGFGITPDSEPNCRQTMVVNCRYCEVNHDAAGVIHHYDGVSSQQLTSILLSKGTCGGSIRIAQLRYLKLCD